MKISETEKGQAWLAQFLPGDVWTATELLDALVFVPTNVLRQWLADEIIRQSRHGRLALYGEREFPPSARFFNRLAAGRRKRAIGAQGPALVGPVRGSPYVGSEGIIAQLLSELAQRRDVDLLLTPGPDRLRPMRSRGPTRRLAIVTDVIGSGNRVCRMLDAMWRTETVRSWFTHRKVDLEIVVIAYATSAKGQDRVKRHALRPAIVSRIVVPSLWDIDFSAKAYEDLCVRYDPRPAEDRPGPFGYERTGTLIAFGHGCPNTTPRLLWQASRRWRPLFPERSAVEFDLFDRPAGVTEFRDRLLAVNRPSLADPSILARFNDMSREALLLLAAISHGLRHSVKLASRTGLDVARIAILLDVFRHAGWINERNRITPEGLAELRAARRVTPRIPEVPTDGVSIYFPSSLRG